MQLMECFFVMSLQSGESPVTLPSLLVVQCVACHDALAPVARAEAARAEAARAGHEPTAGERGGGGSVRVGGSVHEQLLFARGEEAKQGR